jgi:hypothetical protein
MFKQELGNAAIADVYNGASKSVERDRWARTVDMEGTVQDECYVMVAAFRTVCQSIDLVQSNFAYLVEPHPQNTLVHQGKCRSKRIGQERITGS